MRTRNNSPMKRIAAAVAAVAVLFGTAPAVAEQEAPAAEMTQDLTWTVTKENGTESTTKPAVPASEAPASETATAPSPSAKSEQPTVKPRTNTVTEPELAEDVTFKYEGRASGGKEKYTLEAKLNLPADETTEQALPLDRISLMGTEGSLDSDSVEDVAIDGTTLDSESVDLFAYPENPSEDEKARIPDEVKGDVITLDTSEASLAPEAVVTATVYANEKASDDVKWELYRGELPRSLDNIEVAEGAELPGAPLTIKPSDPLDPNKARVIVQVAGDKKLDGTKNGATTVDGRLDRVFENTPGEGAVLRLWAPLNDKPFGRTEYATAWEQGAKGETARPIDQPWATCTADANGECVFDIPRGEGGDTYEYYWVVMEQASPGYEVQDWFRFGVSGDTKTGRGRVLRNAYATPLLKKGNKYFSGVRYHRSGGSREGNGADWGLSNNSAFMFEERTTESQGIGGAYVPYRSSSGSFTQVRENPAMSDQCGMKVALVLDTSGSMGAQGMNALYNIVGSVIDGLAPTNTKLGLYSFSTKSPGEGGLDAMPANLDPLPVNTDEGRKKLTEWRDKLEYRDSLVGGQSRSGGGTNWEDGLKQVADYNAKNPSAPYDVVYFITDGNPTVFNKPTRPTDGNGWAESEMRDVEAAITMANTVKSQNTRIVSVGIPAKWPTFAGTATTEERLASLELSETNLQAISGGQGGIDRQSLRSSDFAVFTDQDVFKQALVNTIKEPCDEPPTPPSTFNFKLSKVDAFDNSTELKGAEFILTGLDDSNTGDKNPATAPGDETSEFNWSGLKPGRYELKEDKAPGGGYVLLSQPVYFRIAREGESTKLYILANKDDQSGIEVTQSNESEIIEFPVVGFTQTGSGNDVQVAMKIANTKVGELPKTGGRGIYTQILLSLLIMLAGTFAARRRSVA